MLEMQLYFSLDLPLGQKEKKRKTKIDAVVDD